MADTAVVVNGGAGKAAFLRLGHNLILKRTDSGLCVAQRFPAEVKATSFEDHDCEIVNVRKVVPPRWWVIWYNERLVVSQAHMVYVEMVGQEVMPDPLVARWPFGNVYVDHICWDLNYSVRNAADADALFFHIPFSTDAALPSMDFPHLRRRRRLDLLASEKRINRIIAEVGVLERTYYTRYAPKRLSEVLGGIG